MSGRVRRPNKNPIRTGRTGSYGVRRRRGREERLRFREGNESCVHRFDCPGGGSFFAARCRVRCTHSLPQETSAGRNLITLFRTVNNSGKFFFGPAPADPDGKPPRRRRHDATIARRASHRIRTNTLKAISGAAFSASRFFYRARALRCAHRVAARSRSFRASFRARRRRCRKAPRFAPHKPICAKVRELFPPPPEPSATADAPRTASAATLRALDVGTHAAFASGRSSAAARRLRRWPNARATSTRMLEIRGFLSTSPSGDGGGSGNLRRPRETAEAEARPRRLPDRHSIDRRRRSSAIADRHRRRSATDGRSDVGRVRSG